MHYSVCVFHCVFFAHLNLKESVAKLNNQFGCLYIKITAIVRSIYRRNVEQLRLILKTYFIYVTNVLATRPIFMKKIKRALGKATVHLWTIVTGYHKEQIVYIN